jgi:hypothetical protein
MMASKGDSALAIRLDLLSELLSDIENSPVFRKKFPRRVLENFVMIIKEGDAAFAELKSAGLTESEILDVREEMMRILEEHVKKHI